jgi:hypothetical protein
MKAAICFLSLIALQTFTFAGTNWGRIVFANHRIPTKSGTGGSNGNGTYDAPIWLAADGNINGQGAGALPGGVAVGLFQYGAPDFAGPLAVSWLRTDANSQFFGIPSTQEVEVPGVLPGSPAVLVIRAWQNTSQSYAAAQASGAVFNEWRFTTMPLGDGKQIPIPGMTGWGLENGSGIFFQPLTPIITTKISAPLFLQTFAAPAEIEINGVGWGLATHPSSGHPEFVITNLTLVVDFTEIANTTGQSLQTISAKTSQLAAGLHTIWTTGSGYWAADPSRVVALPSDKIDINVVTPSEVLLNKPQIANGQIIFSYSANPGLSYIVSGSRNLTDWEPISTFTAVSNPSSFSTAFDGSTSLFYKVMLRPNP